MRRVLFSAIKEKGWNLGLGVAEGPGTSSLNHVEPLMAMFPPLSIDAQGQLCNIKNDLNMEVIKIYLERASKSLGGVNSRNIEVKY